MTVPYVNVGSQSRWFRKLLVVVKQTAYEEYSQLRLRGKEPKALRWKRLEDRHKAHKACVNELKGILKHHNVDFNFINRVALDRQHLANVDLVVAVGGDGTILSSAHFLDHGTIPLLGINSDPMREEDLETKKKMDERRSHGALCICTSRDMMDELAKIFCGAGKIEERTRIRCTVKSTFSETRLVPALNDMLICNPSPAAVSRFRMGWLQPINDNDETLLNERAKHEAAVSSTPLSSVWERSTAQYRKYGTILRFGGEAYDIRDSLNVWSSGMWVSTGTGATAAMEAAGGMPMEANSKELQYLVREHMIEKTSSGKLAKGLDNCFLKQGEQLHMRWNSQKGKIYIDGPHMTHDLQLGDEIMIDANAPPTLLFVKSS